MTRRVVFSPEARNDLLRLYDYIAERSGSERAAGYVNRIVACCESVADFPKRGRLRHDLRPGLRIVSFERRIIIAFDVLDDQVTIDRIFYGDRDVGGAFSELEQ